VWLSGTPELGVTVDAMPDANLAANVYDIAPDGLVTMISRGVQALKGEGVRNFSFTLYGQDWPIPAGHRIGVLISSANTEEFRYNANRQPVTVESATIGLPFLMRDRKKFLQGETTGRLESYLDPGGNTILTEEQIAAAEAPFTLPAKLIGSR
jgi:hypothetical protein